MISKDFRVKYKDLIEKENKDNINIVYEDYQGMYTDRELIIKIGGLENE